MSFATRLDAIRTAPLLSWATCLALCAAIALSACAQPGEGTEWRHAKVVEVVQSAPGSAFASGADGRCVERTDGKAAGEATRAIAIVRYRVTRSYYRQAFPLPSDSTLAVGDRVLVEPDGCAIQRRVATAPALPPIAP